jgi:hypothetical protein
MGYGTSLIFIFETVIILDISLYFLAGKLYQFGLYALFLKFLENMFNQNGRIAIFSCTYH